MGFLWTIIFVYFIIRAVFILFSREWNNKTDSHGYQGKSINLLKELMLLTAVIMKANKIAKKSELEVVKTFLYTHFSENDGQYALHKLKYFLQNGVTKDQINNAYIRITNYTNYETRIQLLILFFQICSADENIDAEELNLLNEIRIKINIYINDYLTIKNSFINSSNSDSYEYNSSYYYKTNDYKTNYEILGVSEKATEQEIKKAFREKAKLYHPDKYANSSDVERKKAENKFKEINNAYETICKQRNIK